VQEALEGDAQGHRRVRVHSAPRRASNPAVLLPHGSSFPHCPGSALVPTHPACNGAPLFDPLITFTAGLSSSLRHWGVHTQSQGVAPQCSVPNPFAPSLIPPYIARLRPPHSLRPPSSPHSFSLTPPHITPSPSLPSLAPLAPLALHPSPPPASRRSRSRWCRGRSW
jgi:hypothetical protein